MYYADLHAHPSGKNFPRYYNNRKEDFQKEGAHLWDIPRSKIFALMKGLRGTSYSQSDVGSLIHYSGKLVYASIYPLEEGFVKNMGTEKDPPAILLHIALRYTLRRIRFLLGDKVDYYEELKAEWEFLQRKSGQPEKGAITLHPSGGTNILDTRKIVKGSYYILSQNPGPDPNFVNPWGSRDFIGIDELDATIVKPDSTVLVLTIEGMHALSMKNSNLPVEEHVLLERIAEIKRWPVFFMTFAHHFDNQLCAHAKSFFKPPLKWAPDQLRNMNYITEILSPDGRSVSRHSDPNKGFTPLGMTALLHLLGMRKNPDGSLVDDPSLGRRILVDTKHMSASSRREFYESIVQPYNQSEGRRLALDGKPPEGCLPVLASHSAYSGVATLDEMIAGYASENDEPREGNHFNYWNINLSAEDLQVIVQSGGLIGLNLDQRILGIMHRVKFFQVLAPGIFKDKSEKRNKTELIADNILGMAKAMKDLNLGLHRYGPDRFSFWDCLCLGTDFDGGIDPVDEYSSAEKIGELRKDLQKIFAEKYARGELRDFIDYEGQIPEIIDQIFWKNAYRFLKKHFQAESQAFVGY